MNIFLEIFKKGDDGVVICKTANDASSIDQAYNPGGYARPTLLDQNNPSIGLSDINVKYENGKIICSFKREKNLANVPNYFDLKVKYYLFLVKGTQDESN